MSSAIWKKRISILLNRLYLYPKPERMAYTRSFWIATGLVALLALSFSVFFILFDTAQHNAYLTHGEDLGIIDQAIWSSVHGQLFHQTVCNIVTDTNCYSPDGISRFAIHFEPILFLFSLLYLLAPNPKTLQVVQALVVASGAFPAFWLARLRLRNEWAGVVIAALYLLYPAINWALIFDFHAVTLTSALLLFMLYFMYTRRTALMFVFAILAMGCKEEIPVLVGLYALWSMVFMRTWRSSLLLVLLAAVWTGTGLWVVHIYSPVGRTLLASRYFNDDLGHTPLQILRTIFLHPKHVLMRYILEHDHFHYLRTLFSPAAYIALLAPWVLVLLMPTLFLNLFSAYGNQYSGLYQYDAEMVPALIFATIEALVLIMRLAQVVIHRFSAGEQEAKQRNEGNKSIPAFPRIHIGWGKTVQSVLLAVLLSGVLFNVLRVDNGRGPFPFDQTFRWPTVTPHIELAQHFIAQIPSDASVSAQSSLVPHISHRTHIYQFPYGAVTDRAHPIAFADYVFLDVTSDIAPYFNSSDFINAAKSVLVNGNYGIVAAQDGYLLMKRGLPSPGLSPQTPLRPGKYVSDVFVLPNLPDTFCSYINVASQEVKHPLKAIFVDPSTSSPTMSLIGYDVNVPSPFSVSSDSLSVTTYWKVEIPTKTPLQVLLFMTDAHGKEYGGTTDVPAVSWCQTHTLKGGTILRLNSRLFNVQASHLPLGIAHLSVALVPLLQPSDTIMENQYRVPVRLISAPKTVTVAQGKNAVQIMPLRVVH